MRAYDLAIFFFSINLVISLVNGLGIMNDSQMQNNVGWSSTIQSEVEGGQFNPSSSPQLTNIDLLWGLVNGFLGFAVIIWNSTIGVYMMVWSLFGYATAAIPIAAAYSSIAYITYLVAVTQWWSGRNVEEGA